MPRRLSVHAPSLRRALIVGAVAGLAVAALPSSARAECTIATSGVSFGDYSVFSTAPDDSSGTITFRCGNDRNIRITLSPGGSGSYDTRQMRQAGGTDRLNYNLYTTATRSVPWGDGTGGTASYVSPNPPNNRDVNVTIYGRIPAGQDVGVGTYTDTVVATINF